MTTKFSSNTLRLSVTLLIIFTITLTPCYSTRVGRIEEVTDPQELEDLQSIAKFALRDYNAKEHASLRLSKVVKASKQVVAGMMYYLTIEARDESKDTDSLSLYEGKVWLKAWQNFKRVQDVHPSPIHSSC